MRRCRAIIRPSWATCLSMVVVSAGCVRLFDIVAPYHVGACVAAFYSCRPGCCVPAARPYSRAKPTASPSPLDDPLKLLDQQLVLARASCHDAQLARRSGRCIAIASSTVPVSHASHASGVVRITGMALEWIGRTTSFASQVRNENRRCSPSTGSALVPRVPVQGRQMPAKANSGRWSLSANQCGSLAWVGLYCKRVVGDSDPCTYHFSIT